MTALTAGALAAVGFLAYQASANAPAHLGTSKPGASPSASASPAPKGKDKAGPVALPARSGTGERVVYALGADRVWLVGGDGKARRTYRVTPGTVDPAPGNYAVTSRSGSVTGTDGVPIEHVVRFASAGGVPVGFSAAVDGSTPSPDPAKQTGGIRESRADGAAMWEFATHGRKVVVVP
ncbi:hypothetical protein ACIRF8_02270 [Streptomyces sp. NPDC102406]|uniref:hypothetical protein n=1 Tax=Streptomyces sp. NPDC102406 TaxID=3366171 RepID=UPI003827420B